MDFKEQIKIGISQASDNFAGFDYDYYTALVLFFAKNVNKKVKIQLQTEDQAIKFGLHFAYYDQTSWRVKDCPCAHMADDYTAVYIEEKHSLTISTLD